MPYNTNKDNTIVDDNYKLTKKQLDFCIYYTETGNGTQSAIRAGYKETTARWQASNLLTKPNIRRKIHDLQHQDVKHRIATANEVMDFFTRVMNGQVKDQFGLEASLSDRLKAANELAKRTVDIEQKAEEKDNSIHIKLDWGTTDGTEEKEKTKP